MARRFLAIAFMLAAFAPQAFVSAQQSPKSTTHAAPASKSTSASHASHSTKHRHGNVPPWSNSVYVNGGSAAQYFATPKPQPPPGKNKVNTGGQVFKSISN